VKEHRHAAWGVQRSKRGPQAARHELRPEMAVRLFQGWPACRVYKGRAWKVSMVAGMAAGMAAGMTAGMAAGMAAGKAGPGETLESLWPPLAIHPRGRAGSWIYFQIVCHLQRQSNSAPG
jgi:hypothetical protein